MSELVSEGQQRLQSLASAIDQAVAPAGARLHTVQFVSCSSDGPEGASADDSPLVWETLSRDLPKYGEAVLSFTQSHESGGRLYCRRTLVRDEWASDPYWHVHVAPPEGHGSTDPSLNWLDQPFLYGQTIDSELAETGPAKSLQIRLAAWRDVLAYTFSDIPFTSVWISQPHHDPRTETRVVSSVFVLLSPQASDTGHLYAVARAARDFIIDHLVRHFAGLEDKIRQRRLRRIADLISDDSGFDLMLEGGASRAARLAEIAMGACLPLTILGPASSGKTSTALRLARQFRGPDEDDSPVSLHVANCQLEADAKQVISLAAKSLSESGEDKKNTRLVIDNVHFASPALQYEIEGFLDRVREYGDRRADAPRFLTVVVGDRGLSSMVETGKFSDSLWRKLNMVKESTVEFSSLTPEIQKRAAQRMVDHLNARLTGQRDSITPDQLLADGPIWTLGDLRNTAIKLILRRTSMDLDIA